MHNHPNRAKSEATQCLAFCKKDIRRCRLERIPNKKTCAIHKNYYSTWIDSHYPILAWPTLTQREKEEYIFQVSNRHVVIPEAFIRILTPIEIQYFQLLVGYTDHSPFLNKPCFIKTIQHYANLYVGKPDMFIESLKPYIKTHKDLLFAFTILLEEIFINISRSSQHGFDLLDWFMLRGFWRPLLYSTAFMEIFSSERSMFQRLYPDQPELWSESEMENPNKPIKKFITNFNKYQVYLLKKQRSIFKEDLMAAAWHPRRVEKWLELGLDPEDL